MKPFNDLGIELCNGNKIYFDYFMKFFAHMIQKPYEKIPISFIIKGKQGTGKNVFLNCIGNLLDKKNYISSCKPSDFFGEYAEGFYHKLLVNINECEGKDTFDFEGKLKSFISEETITMNPKHLRPTVIKNFARLIIFTNKSTPIPIDIKSKDRRYVVYQTTDTYLDYKYSSLFWKRLIDHFNKPEFLACLYNFLNNLDISNWDFKKERPITKAYIDMCKSFIPIESIFFEYFIDNKLYNNYSKKLTIDNYNSQISIKGNDLYNFYTKWANENHYNKEFQPNPRSFYSKLIELEFPFINKKVDGLFMLYFVPNVLYNYLSSRNWLLFNDNFIKEEIINKSNHNFCNEYFGPE
jgi:hypothetical protein